MEEREEYIAEKALVPVDERRVEFYEDELAAVVVEEEGGRSEIYVPLKPIAEALGLAWPSQFMRLQRDLVLSSKARLVIVTIINPPGRAGRPDMVCLPLKYLPGWLFGVNAARVREELRDKILRYQDECYDALAVAFMPSSVTVADSPAMTSLAQIREMGLAIVRMAEQQMEYERRITTTESRLDRAAAIVGQIQNRLTAVERKLAPGNPITDEQASEVQAAVHGLAMLLTEQDMGKNHFQGIFNELHRRFGVTSYKLIPQGKYADVLAFLREWRDRAV
jgi:hypothetical protein